MLTINHDNYDTWLMLYLDNELTAAEREAVEAFAKANPAMQEELDGLRETMLQPETPVAMPGKERLLMPELWNEEALTLQQQQLLLLADNELVAGEKGKVEMAINHSPLLQKEWSLLQKTKVSTGMPLEMPGKDKLYRYERTRVIPFGRVIRFAAAAAILGFGWFFVNKLMLNPSGEPQNGQVAIQPSIEITAPAVKENDSIVNPEVEVNQPLKETVIDYAAVEKGDEPLKKIHHSIARNTVPENENMIPEKLVGNEQSLETYESTTARLPEQKLVGFTTEEVEGITEHEKPLVLSTANIELAVNTQMDKPSYNNEVVNSEESSDEGTISIGGARIPKQKIRNVYRNITRPITRTLERGGIQLAYAK
jgi:hypothetical protein